MSNSEKYTNIYPAFESKDFDFFNEFNSQKKKKNEINFCLAYIQNRLQHQSISAIVGAGFSKNANSKFPDWATLLTDAYSEMYPPPKNTASDNDTYKKDIAKIIHRMGEPSIASEYEKFKGMRESLDIYLEKHISEIQSSKLNLDIHQELLNLNWCDIITTNWDCLLEEANKATNQYSLVTNAKDLRINNKKRIIKIHGSIRENPTAKDSYKFDGCFDHLYIITDSDYNNYHINHEGFSNFMRVKMLENSLCLFGFSGNDWNFRFWIKELKRMMTKGGEKKNLNPIFLFDTKTEKHDEDEIQFFENNYIIPLKIDDVLKCISKDFEKNSPKANNQPIREKFSQIFKFFTPKKEKIRSIQDSNKYKRERYLLQNFINSTDENSLLKFIREYPKLPRFRFINLPYSQIIVRRIQPVFSQIEKWTEHEYFFIYTWCINNFFSLSQLFTSTQINSIIKRYIEKKYFLKKANEFAELIFKHYVDYGDENQINKFAEIIGREKDDLTFYYKSKFFIKKLEYKKLTNLLNKWDIENRIKANPRFLLGKINALIAFENFRFHSSHSTQIENLFEQASHASNNNEYSQLHTFILLYYASYLRNSGKEYPQHVQSELDALKNKKCDYPYDFIKNLSQKQNNESIRPNSKKRYQNTITLSTDNFWSLSSKRIINFFEYTSLSMYFFLPEKDFIKLIENSTNKSDYLLYLFSLAIPYYGHSSDEDFLQCVIPAICRNINSTQKDYIFNKAFEIFKIKIENKEDLKSYCYIMDELTKRADTAFQQKYFDFFYKHFFEQGAQQSVLEQLVDKGRIWGIYNPFLNFLANINDEKIYKQFLDWVIERKLAEGSDAFSGYQSYYDKLLQNTQMNDFLKKYFHSSQIKKKLKKNIDRSLYLILDAHYFQDPTIKDFAKKHLSDKMSLNINPYFVKECYSTKLKSKLLNLITTKNYNMESSAEWPICDFIDILHKINKLTVKDLCLICQTITPRIKRQINDNYRDCSSLFEWNLDNYYEIIQEAASDLHAEQEEFVKECLDLLSPNYKNNARKILKYDWLNTASDQNLRNNFDKAFSYAEFLHQEDNLIQYIGLMLAKILTQDNQIFEAILQIFTYKCQTDVWQKRITKNKTIKFYVKCLIEKFQNNIPMCYDDIFIKEQIGLLKKIFNY
ncbi:SIR2 family protein [Fibrobacter sp. UWB7]|uniref:SIR2 family protein n=1 Tax=Fibrobacter sp. UWB7 TaxID=1896206 RepID=UPI0009108F97|nr:SIR2 family protein [Fibrobacter sp. UWB7]SHM37366.1 SIR2-like domain-containing protein [Fibrobacter sp. UWB7]